MIISASYKTDIPAFYGEWFRNRLHAGFCRMANPYNRNQRIRVSLRKEDVDGFIFWTKNLTPFFGVLDEVHARGYPFIVQYTVNGYPRELESRVVDATKSVASFRIASQKYGAKALVWRYDTIIFSSLTDAEFHRRNFARLAEELSGFTDEVVVSFMQIYRKTKQNLDEAARIHDFEWHDPPAEEKRELLTDLVRIAAERHMGLSICTHPDLVVPGVKEARCIDGQRLMDIAGHMFKSKVKGMREGCGCFESRDIGDYDTCPHGCVYCYAVRRRSLALQRYQAHDQHGEYLFPQAPLPPPDEAVPGLNDGENIPLFLPEREL